MTEVRSQRAEIFEVGMGNAELFDFGFRILDLLLRNG